MKKRLLAGFLTVTMLVSLFPIPALALEGERPEWAVTAFDPLDEGTALQTVSQGGGEPVMPDTLTAWAYHIEDDTDVTVSPEETEQTPTEGEQPPANEQGPDIQQITIPGVTWTAEPEYDHNTPGAYIYTPVLPAAYAVDEGVELPAITVTVEAAREQTAVERVQALIDALPDPEGITLDNAEDVAAQLAAIDEASEALTGEEQAALDFARYEAVMLALAALMDDAPALLATASNIKYLDCDANGQNWTTTTCSSATVVESSTTTWGAAGQTTWYVVNSDVTFSSRITVNGTVHLILADGYTLNAKSGAINVSSGKSLTIYAQSTGANMGQLSTTGRNDQAGIGSGFLEASGTITINGGNITANGGSGGAGIGSGYKGEGGTITINGGTVVATGSHSGAGIGGGLGKDGGTITINGGTVTARGGDCSAGIGGGNEGGGGTITISGGTVTATGGGNSAGIGGGYLGGGGAITISGGTVTATGGGNSAGIGGGNKGAGGAFSTGANGGALISASSISDQSGKENWSGVIIQGNSGEAYGNPTLTGDATIPSGKTVTIPVGKTLTIPEGVTLTNDGTITISGTLTNNGAIIQNGTINGSVGGNGGYGVWVTFDANGGSAVTPSRIVNIINGDYQFPASDPSKTGYTFDGWYTAASGGEKVESTTTVTTPSAHTLYAHWTGIKSTVTFDANKGSVTAAPKEVTYNDTYGELPTPTRSGYTFTGWYTAASGGTKIESTTQVTITAAQTLYAHWTENKSQVTVTFSNANPAYGDTITITATIAAANTNGLRAAAQDTVTFSLDGTTLGTANVSGSTATLSVTLTGENWKPGSKTITAEFGGSSAYTGSNGTGTLTVQKATPTVTPPTAKSLTYTGAAQGLISTGSTTGGTLQYSTDNSTWGTSVPTGTDAKTYTVYYKVAGDDCFNDVAVQSVTVTISPKSITGTISITGTATMGETLTANYTDSGETVSYQWYRGNNPISGATGNAYTIVAADVGQTIKVTVTGTGNYNGTATSSQTAAVGKATPTVSQWPTASAITYGQSLSDSNLTGGTASVAGTFTWTNTGTKPAVSDSGTTQYDVIFTPSVAGYNTVTGGKVTLTVNKATLTPSATANGKTYDGTTDATGTISLTGAVNSESPAASGTFAFENADVGTGRTVNVTNITLTGDWGANYRLSSDSTTTTATIDPKSISGATVELGDSLTYTGQQQEQVVQSVTIGNLTATYTVSDNQQTNAGTYTLTVTGNGNFTGTLTKDFTIAKATTNSITGLTCDNIVFGGTPSPTATATFGTPTYSYSNQQSGTYGVWNTSNAKGTWYVKATVAGTDNYNGAEQIISFQVTAQQEATPSASIDYGAETLTGLTAGASYSITPTGGTAVTVTANENGTINIQSGWFGKTLSIVKKAQSDDYSDSAAQSLFIPARPNRPTVQGVNETFSGENDGQITSTSTAMEYGTDGDSWTDCGGTSVTGLTPGTYYVRTKAVTGPSPASFASDYATVTIQAGPQRTYTLEVTAPAFTAATYGYTQPAAQAITITSKGNSAATISSVTVSGSDFTIGGSGNSVTAGNSITSWTVQPNAGLGMGTHTGTITVTYNNNATATATVSFTVSKAALTPTASANGKTYDGTTTASGTINLSGAVSGENPAASGTFAFENANAGTGKTVNVTGITLTGDWSANYQLSTTSITTTANITPKPITGATVTLGDSLTYTGQQQTQTVSSVEIDGLTAAYTVSGNTGTDAKSYTLTVTGTGNFNGTQTAQFTIAKATTNSITGLTCGNIVFGGTPSPSATATFGTPTYSYSNQQSGTYGTWDTSNAKGTWYVKATVADTDNYNGAEQIISFQVTAQREDTPSASIDYGTETLTGLTARASYSLTPAGGTAVTVAASENGTINIQPGWFGKTLSIVKKAQSDDYSDSAAQSLPIPARPNRPTAPLTLTKAANSITITNSYPNCEFSADGTSWNDTGAFTGLTAGTEYTVHVRVKATASTFKSDSMTQAVTTVKADGSTTVKPGESAEIGTSPKTTVTNDGEKITITTGGTTTTVTPAGEVEVGTGGGVAVPGGSTVKTGDDGPEVKLPQGGTIGGDGGITVPGGGTVQVGTSPSTTITVPEGGGTIQPKPGGTVDVPSGSTVKTGDDGPEITIGPGNGGTVGGDGGITVPEGGTVQVGKDPATTITPPTGGEVKPKGDGTVEVPEGTTVKPGGGGLEVTVGPGNGGTVGDDGGVTVPGGGKVTVKGDPDDTTITLPSGGGTVKPNPDGTIPLPGGSTVEKGGTTTDVPDTGGTYNPSTGSVTENVHTVTFDSQGGSAVNSATATHGGKVVKPGNPTRSGYTFGGWYKESGCTTAWNFDTDTVTGDITLYAKWTQNSGGGGGWYNPPSVTTYPITTPATSSHGKLTVSPVHASRNTTVTITVTPEDGYRLGILNVTSGGKVIPLTEKGSGKYTFTMPAGTVKVEATFVPAETPGTTWINPFADVPEGAWYYDAVRFVSENGLMGGYGNGLFGVNDDLSRAQLAQILFNKEGRPVVNYLLQYGDVSTGTWYTEAVRWATSQGIVGGYGNGNFGPNDPITREQLAVMLWRYSGSPAATNKELHFNDTDEISGFALEAMRWAVENGIINGYGNGRLGPQGQATRAQVAQMLKNFLENREDED